MGLKASIEAHLRSKLNGKANGHANGHVHSHEVPASFLDKLACGASRARQDVLLHQIDEAAQQTVKDLKRHGIHHGPGDVPEPDLILNRRWDDPQ